MILMKPRAAAHDKRKRKLSEVDVKESKDPKRKPELSTDSGIFTMRAVADATVIPI